MRIGLVGEQWIHTHLYPAFFNGVNETFAAKAATWTKKMLEPHRSVADPEMNVTGFWSGGADDNGLNEIWNLTRYDTMDELCENVDAAIILEKDGSKHFLFAEVFLKNGLPVFVDKPFATTVEDACQMIRLAEQNHTAIVGSSALAHTVEVADFLAVTPRPIPRVIDSYGSGEYWEYAAHPIALGLSLLQERVKSVMRRQLGNTWHWLVDGEDGAVLSVHLITRGAFPGYRATVCADNGMKDVVIQNMPQAFGNMAALIKKTFASRQPQIDYSVLIDSVRIYSAPLS